MDLSPKTASNISGERGTAVRPQLLFRLLEPIAQHLPADIELHGSDHDMGSWLLGDDQEQAALQAIKEGRYLTAEELKEFEKRIGRREVERLRSACPEDSRAWKEAMAEKADIAGIYESLPGESLHLDVFADWRRGDFRR